MEEKFEHTKGTIASLSHKLRKNR